MLLIASHKKIWNTVIKGLLLNAPLYYLLRQYFYILIYFLNGIKYIDLICLLTRTLYEN